MRSYHLSLRDATNDARPIVSRHLHDDSDGGLWLVNVLGEDNEALSYLGPIDDPDTAHEVPADLWDDYTTIMADHDDAIAFGAACRSEAGYVYDSTRGRLA